MKHMKNDKAGVSPVIATLILVLIAVAAGVAFFAWQSGWQEDATGNISNANAQTEITIGGSSTVYPFTAVAAEAFMEANPTVKISYQSGGSGAGTAGVREGVIDIGAASSDRTQAKHFPDHPDVVITAVGYDAVGVVVDDGNTRINDINATVAIEIFTMVITDWNQVPVASGASGTGTTGAAGSETTVTVSTGTLAIGRYRMWSATTLVRTVDVIAANTLPSDLFGASASISWQVITSATSAPIEVYDRADKSGTEECFNEKLLGLDGSSIPEGDQTGVAGNQEMLDLFEAGAPNAIGFISTGVATSDVKLVTLDGVAATEENIADGSYTAQRPLNYMYIPSQLGGKLAIVEAYIDFCMSPKNNIDFAHSVDYLSWYDLE
ncbi:MAG: substrate-binding domain-containing protein [Candidatus Thermoplasmatota archaeon]|nr:substrate-binding domain-containing protein [Candidatus Thermoplasmatota archaeon]